MSYADTVFINMCRNILTHGTDTSDDINRPHWPDGQTASTIKLPMVYNVYDLSKEFPALTLRPTAIKTAMDELLWIWQKKSNNIHDLNSHIWDEWADENGSIGAAYGYQLRQVNPYKSVSVEKLKEAFPDCVWQGANLLVRNTDPGTVYGIVVPNKKGNNIIHMNQVDKVLYDLHHTPYSRRIMTSMYNFADLDRMALHPCAYSMTFNVTKDADGNRVLNGLLNQRSNDVLTANNWNVVQYALLIMMFAQVSGMKPGLLGHMIADAHIYDRHIDIISDLIKRKPLPAPTVRLNPDVKNFYDFTTDDLIVENYQKHPQVRNIPVAI